jgi:hypothetical protein
VLRIEPNSSLCLLDYIAVLDPAILHSLMDDREVMRVEGDAEGVLVTFADGYTFLFSSNFLYKVRLKEGQLTGGPSDKSVG